MQSLTILIKSGIGLYIINYYLFNFDYNIPINMAPVTKISKLITFQSKGENVKIDYWITWLSDR
jgi:hypothetical protein